jgi:glycosyltransferase involved in cell wall biosynthesis
MRQKEAAVMHVLVVGLTFARPLTGGDMRVMQMLKRLMARHDVEIAFVSRKTDLAKALLPCPARLLNTAESRTVVAADEPGNAGAAQPQMEELSTTPSRRRPFRNMLRMFKTVEFGDLFYLYDPACIEPLVQLVRNGNFDVVQFEGTLLAPYVVHLRRMLPGTRIFLDCFDVEFMMRIQNFRRELKMARPLKQYARIINVARWERRAFAASDLCFIVNPRESSIARVMSPRTRFVLVPNGADFSDEPPLDGAEVKGRLLFMGSMGYAPNVDGCGWFVREVWPLVKSKCPDASFEIVGRNPCREVLELGRTPGILIAADVPSMQPHLSKAQVVVVPLRMGTGTRLKILEGLAAGKALVSTRIGASGLELMPARHLLIADTAHDFATAVTRLLGDPQLRAELGQRGMAQARRKYAWSRVLDPVEDAYEMLCSKNRPVKLEAIGDAHA